MAIVSKLLFRSGRVLTQNVRCLQPSITKISRDKVTTNNHVISSESPGFITRSIVTVQTSSTAVHDDFLSLGNFILNHNTMPVVEIMDPEVLDKLMEYSTISPRPVSIEELMEKGDKEYYTEEQSYNFLRKEVAVRLAHMLMELQHLPKELHKEEMCDFTIRKYSRSFSEIIKFENRKPSPEALQEFMQLLFTFKNRHKDTVHNMAEACTSMKNRLNISVSDSNSLIFNSIKVFLDRLYTSRIGIHMITDQHLVVYGYERMRPNSIGVIRPNCDLTSVLVDAMDEATFEIENNYMAAPKVMIKVHNSVNKDEAPQGHLVPSHMFIIFYEVLKNAMRATVEHHWEDKENMPDIEVLICQANDDFTIKISDQGGGMDRVSAAKCFFYQYSTVHPKDGSGSTPLGFGLPLAKLYARYFNGDLRVASYEGYGTDVFIYTRALASSARERLPVYNRETVDSWSWFDDDWSSGQGTVMMQQPDCVKCNDVTTDKSKTSIIEGNTDILVQK